uniref:Bromo domain-containing protein n=1 Tax=Schistosoma mansoni TaxID=6183 RepID=A0A3Q0KRV0_SCHMA
MDSHEQNPEVSLSWEILESLMSRQHAQVNYLFMDDPEPVKGNNDNKNVATVPISLKRMNEKFLNGTYRGIREFVCDFRLMLLNCYRHNGISSRIGRCAEKLELLLEQKLQLLSPEIRTKASIQSTLGFGTAEDELLDCGVNRRRSSGRLFLSGDTRQLTPMRAIIEELEHVTHPGSGGGIAASLISNSIDSNNSMPSNQQQSATTTNITNNLSIDENVGLIIARLSLWERRRHEEELLDSWNEWWIEKNGPKLQEIIYNIPELLEVYQFLWLADPFLGISDCLTIYSNKNNNNNNNNHNLIVNSLNNTNHSRNLSLFDLEIGLCSAPQASLVLNVCMSNLLATPKERNQIVAVLNNNNSNNNGNNVTCNLNIGADSGTDCISSTRRSRNLSNTSTLPVIDYDVWERRLSSRIDSWYRLFWEKGKGVVEWATRRLGLSKGFFDVCGYKLNPLTNKRFHELAIYQQVVIIYALCESTMRTFENLRLSLDKSADWEASNPVYLGTDFFSKYTYIHLPNSIGIDPATSLRIYRISYVKHQPVELNFEKSLNITINRNLDDTSKTEVLNDFIKFENAVAVDQSTNAKRRRSCTKSKQQIQFYEELNKHNTLIMENGLSIPGSVQRLPNWIHPSLARDVYRRWYRVTEQVNSTPSSIVNSSTILSNDQESEESGKGKKRRLSERNSRTVDVNNNNNNTTVANKTTTPNNRKRKHDNDNSDSTTTTTTTITTTTTTTTNSNHVKENVPFGDFQDIDNQIISEFIKKDHCLNPSPYASFNGPTRQFLSLQLSRTAVGGLRFCSKYSSRRNKNTVRTNDDDDDDDGDDDDDTESHSADQNPNDIRSPSVSHYESDDDVENGDNISRTVATTDEVPQVNDKYVDESFMPTRRSTRLSELSKNRTPVNCSINSNGTSSSLPEDQKHGTSEEVVIEQSDMKCNQTFSDKQLTHSDQLCDKISNEDNCDENITKVEENLITEPSSELFTLIAKDSQELNQLLIILRQILSINEEKLNKKQSIDELDLNSDCDNPIEEEADDDGNINNKESVTNKKRTLAEQNENTKNQQTIRLRNAIGSLKSLIANLEELYKSVLNRENERVDAQRLARLRLRKDVEQWEANEAEKSRKQLKMNQTNKLNNQESRLNLLASLQTDLSKDRAERHSRREQLRAQDLTNDEAYESESNDSESNEQNIRRQSNNSPKSITVTMSTDTKTSSMKNINQNSYQAFASRISASGSPKIPISRFNSEDLIPKIRRSFMFDSSKNVSILPRPSGGTPVKPTSPTSLNNNNHNTRSGINHSFPRVSHSTFRSNTPRSPAILRTSLPKTSSSSGTNHPNGVSALNPTTSPLSNKSNISSNVLLSPKSPTSIMATNTSSTSPPPTSITNTNTITTPTSTSSNKTSTPVRKIYRVCNTLFTEDAKPVKIGPNGSLILIPPDSIPLNQRQLARQMISRYHQHVNAISIKPNSNIHSPTSSLSSTSSSSSTLSVPSNTSSLANTTTSTTTVTSNLS